VTWRSTGHVAREHVSLEPVAAEHIDRDLACSARADVSRRDPFGELVQEVGQRATAVVGPDDADRSAGAVS